MDAGIGYLVFAQPAFWWLDYFSGLRCGLEKDADCILDNSRLKIFVLPRHHSGRHKR